MALITNFEQLRTYVKFISSSDAASGMIDTQAAEIKYVRPILTAALYNELNAAVAAENVPEDKVIVLGLARAVGAYMSVYHNLALVQVNLTDTGLKKADTENFTSAQRWEYLEVKEHLIDQAGMAMESLITYLVENANALQWVNVDYTGSIFKTGSEFAEVFHLHQPHRTFWSLRPLIREAEAHVNTTIGSAFYASLKQLTEPDEEEIEAIRLAKLFVANMAINKSLEKQSVKITPEGFTVLLYAAPDKSSNGQRNAPDNQLSLLYNSTKADAKKYLSKLKNHLDSKATDEVFGEYFTSGFYTNLKVQQCNGNSRRKGVFGM